LKAVSTFPNQDTEQQEIVCRFGHPFMLVHKRFFERGGFFGFLGELLGAVWGSFMLLVFYGILGGTLAVLYFAAAESIQVLMDIEKNTRSE